MNKYSYEAYRYAIVVCRDHLGRFLCVKQNLNRGWWLPGGKVRLDETFAQAAVRQCQEETLIRPTIKGIIRIDYGKYYVQNCIRCLYYCEPEDSTKLPKKTQDKHSQKAQFLSIDQILSLKSQWRGTQIYQFPKYITDNKPVYPLQIFMQNFNSNTK